MKHINVQTGKFVRGSRYPTLDFRKVEAIGITNDAGVVACNNEELKQQIVEILRKNPDAEEINYFYYEILDDKK